MSTKQTSRDDKAHSVAKRPARVPMSAALKLDYAKREGFRRSWELDDGSKLDIRVAAWWEFVKDENGNNITRSAGGGKDLYLMEIKEEYYQEDDDKFQAENDQIMRQIEQPSMDEYVPATQKSIIERKVEF